MSATTDFPGVTPETVIDTLKTMSKADVDNVRKQLLAYTQFGTWDEDAEADEVDVTSDGRRVFRIIVEEMASFGLADLRTSSYFRLNNRRDFNAKAEWLCRFLREQSPARLVQDGIMRVGIQLLVRWFQRHAEEVQTYILTPEIVARNIAKVPARLDREFPGYGACGMLHLLIKT